METDTTSRYRSRILREMNANRENPFNSPPSSTGSHGTVSPTLTSAFSDPDGESTRRLNEDIARVTGGRKLPVNWEVAHRKWPEFFSNPKERAVTIFEDDTETRPLSSQSKENRPPSRAVKPTDGYNNGNSIWNGSKRTRAEMQPYVDNDSDMSSLLDRSPDRRLSGYAHHKPMQNHSSLSQVHTQARSPQQSQPHRMSSSISDALDQLRRTSLSPKAREHKDTSAQRYSPRMSSAKSSLTAVPPSPGSVGDSPGQNASNVRSFFMPDVSHLGDFVTGTLRFSGSMKNGVPIFVKHGRVHDQQQKLPSPASHAHVDGLEVPEDEEKIFVSMDMIRDEIVSLQEHYDKVQDYAESLQQQVENLESQLTSRKPYEGGSLSRGDDKILALKNQLETEVTTLKSQLDEAKRKSTTNEIEKESLAHERDRAVSRLQDACTDISKLTRKLTYKEKELENSQRSTSSSNSQQENDTLRRDLISLKHGRDALELENSSLRDEAESFRSENNRLRKDNEALISENRSLRSSKQTLAEAGEDHQENLDGLQYEIDAVREEMENLQQELESAKQDKLTLRQDNDSLVRHNDKYFSENKVLRRENSGFERSIHDLHQDNAKLQEQIDFLKQQLDHCRPIPKDDFSARLDDVTEENMTSAFFLPDITMNTNMSVPAENTKTKDMTGPIADADQDEQNARRPKSQERARSKSRGPANRAGAQNHVAFSIPEDTIDSTKNSVNVANKGSKRSAAPRRVSLPDLDFLDNDDTTGMQSVDDMTQDRSLPLDLTTLSHKSNRIGQEREPRAKSVSMQPAKDDRERSRSRSVHKRNVSSVSEQADRNSCPALSDNARRVLDNLCKHNCRNCIVCSRITSHRGVVSSSDAASGKKRVTVHRPVPVTDRDLSVEDPTIRPSQSPGHALALVIKGLEDEAYRMQLELAQLQNEYNRSDKSHGRRDRVALVETIRTLLKRLEVKNDQIYTLYDVLEGQKVAGQAMTEEELEMTVLSITGMTVRDVTSGSDQITWEGIQDA